MRPRCWLTALVLLCVPLSVAASPLEMVSNGDFEQDLSVGWFERLDATYGTIVRTTTADPDPDYEAQLSVINGTGDLGLVQRFAVPDLGLAFAATLKATASGTNGAWAAAGLMLTYRDRYWGVLGNTAIVYPSLDCPWTDTPTFHVIGTGLDMWETYTFELTDELANLPGIDRDAIEWIDVALVCVAENC